MKWFKKLLGRERITAADLIGDTREREIAFLRRLVAQQEGDIERLTKLLESAQAFEGPANAMKEAVAEFIRREEEWQRRWARRPRNRKK